MSVESLIIDPGTKQPAIVTKFGQLVTAPIDYSTPVTKTLAVVNNPVNFVTPVTGSQIVITDIILFADKNVSANTPATVEIYQASSATSDLVDVAIITPQLLRAEGISITGLNMITEKGKWVNAKTDDNAILLTIMFYYVPVKEG